MTASLLCRVSRVSVANFLSVTLYLFAFLRVHQISRASESLGEAAQEDTRTESLFAFGEASARRQRNLTSLSTLGSPSATR